MKNSILIDWSNETWELSSIALFQISDDGRIQFLTISEAINIIGDKYNLLDLGDLKSRSYSIPLN